MLRAKKPEAIQKRLKLFMFGGSGVGKTTAAIQFPNAYIIDGERGTENYDKLITAADSVVFPTTSLDDVIQEVRSLLTEQHEYRTLIIDPITTFYSEKLDQAEEVVGSEFGRHYGKANKSMKRLLNLLTQLDMNVVMTAHAKNEYGDNLKVTGRTFDGYKKLDYFFDLVVEVERTGKHKNAPRKGRVIKTRLEAFPDCDEFVWSYETIVARYGRELVEREAQAIVMATPDQVAKLKALLDLVRLPEGLTDKWLDKANAESWEDMPAAAMQKCIEYVVDKLRSAPNGGHAVSSAAPQPHSERPPSAATSDDASTRATAGAGSSATDGSNGVDLSSSGAGTSTNGDGAAAPAPRRRRGRALPPQPVAN